ncbi:unnamed protein product (macronuclear) [Paramecium tetraurelia]|uniref:Uncharacterized protein n=1 Tax=Paramecium tetraurelia TaxID=5888 RepID=A0CHD6_PARTE|nr:uncharacterized protein GSPATT00038305001 [Paramecium tetraurelia]CAK70203.1 unnamed protein product [Paramecium tetraurelia]|eukprot:XP_001437600.1 hypothetical protein (macronuclear) [Paramecium tetraurelia strain d4-2]
MNKNNYIKFQEKYQVLNKLNNESQCYCQPIKKYKNQKQIIKWSKLYRKTFKLIREMIADLDKPEVSKEILENHTIKLINNTKEQDLKVILQLLIQIQHLNKLNNLDEHIIILIERNQKQHSYHAQIIQLLHTLKENVSIQNLPYTYRFLRICYRIKQLSNNKIIIVNTQVLNDEVLTQIGQSCKGYLMNKQESEKNILAILNFFMRIADGSLDTDFDDAYALKALSLILEEFQKLKILLDIKIAEVINSNLSALLKSNLNKTTQSIQKLQSIFKLIEILLLGNSCYFFDFLDTLKKHLFSECHSIQKQLSYQTIVNCTDAFIEYLGNDKYKNEFVAFYTEITKQTQIENINIPHKLKQIHEVVGHFIQLENIYQEYSDNKQILKFIAEFNLRLSQQMQKPQLLLQKQIKKCMKNLLSKIEFEQINQTYYNYIQVMDTDVRNSMIIHLIEQNQIAFVTQLLYQMNDISTSTWQKYIQYYLKIKESNEQTEQLMKQLLLNEKLLQIEVLLFSLFSCKCYQLIIQLCNIHYNALQFDLVLQFLYQELMNDIEQQHTVELICSLIILIQERSNHFQFDYMLKMIQLKNHNELLLHYLQTISNKVGMDQLLSLLTQCLPSQLISTILYDCVQTKEIDESDLDLILYILQKQDVIDDHFIAHLMDMIANKEEYAVTLFNIISQKKVPVKLIFYIGQQIQNQKYYNKDTNQQLLFNHQVDINYLYELCQFTYGAGQIDANFIESQLPYFEKLIETQQNELLEEVTRVIKFYLQNFPTQQCLIKLISKYEYLYNHGNSNLTQTLIQIVPDLKIILSLLEKDDQQFQQFENKLDNLHEYAEFAEYMEKHQIALNSNTESIEQRPKIQLSELEQQ